MENNQDIPSIDDVTNALVAALAASSVAFVLYDADQQLRYANAAFRAILLPGHEGPIGHTEVLRYGFERGHGIKVDDGHLERVLGIVQERWRHKPTHAAFESDLMDGRWMWVTESWLPNGWMLGIMTDITALKHNEKSLRQAHQLALQASRTDTLTGLPNRRHMLEEAQEALNRCRAANTPLSIAMIDLDHFKNINDCHGHTAGDKVLCHFAQTCRNRLREEDLIGRIGGEEFLLLLPGANLEAALAVVERMRRDFPAVRIEAALPDMHYTFSAGLAEAAEMDDLDTLIRRADTALYRAKDEGRGRIRGCPRLG